MVRLKVESTILMKIKPLEQSASQHWVYYVDRRMLTSSIGNSALSIQHSLVSAAESKIADILQVR